MIGIMEMTDRTIRDRVGTGYDPKELEELRALYMQLPPEHRAAVRAELSSARSST